MQHKFCWPTTKFNILKWPRFIAQVNPSVSEYRTKDEDIFAFTAFDS